MIAIHNAANGGIVIDTRRTPGLACWLRGAGFDAKGRRRELDVWSECGTTRVATHDGSPLNDRTLREIRALLAAHEAEPLQPR